MEGETMTEAPPMVCYSRGVLDSLIHKLTDARKTHPQVEPLLADLQRFREDPVNKVAGATHWLVNVWMMQNRQLFYDIEDMIDLKTKDKDGSLIPQKEFEEQIDEFKARIQETCDRCKRYELLEKAQTSDSDRKMIAAPSKVEFDFQSIWDKKGVLVGLDGPRKELQQHMEDTQERKVVSILGIEGIGKTTLAAKVYQELKGEFQCHASVFVGRNLSIAALKDVLLQVNPEMVGQCLNEQEVIPQLRDFLKEKKYLIFIDDIRNKHSWRVINCALPYNENGSRILVTTRVKDVAVSCSIPPVDVIYEMNCLKEDDSRRLFNSMISPQTGASHDDMLKMCHNLPLAIIVTSGLLAIKSSDLVLLGKFEESSLPTLNQYSTSDGMSNVLDICFADLSPPVKACFLYLSTFPENYTVEKGRLIWRWVAEGFVPKMGQSTMRKTGEGYFNELICRKLIQPVLDEYSDDQVVACTVHPVIHDYIRTLSREEDFHRTAEDLISGPLPYDIIRRLSVVCNSHEISESDTLESSDIDLSRVRSLMVFGNTRRLPDIRTFKHLRVLDLEDTKALDDKEAERIKHLFLLRYLGLSGTSITELPKEIMELQHLAILDLRRTDVTELPSCGHNKLQSLLGSILTIPTEMGVMEQLEELSEVLLGRDALLKLDGSHPGALSGLVSKSKRLRVLGVKFGYPAEIQPVEMKCFLEEVGESNLQSLSFDDYPSDSVALLANYCSDKLPDKLRKFELRICEFFTQVPADMASIKALTHLHIQVKVVESEDFHTLGSLPNLVLLKLYSEESTQERLTIGSKDGFPCLKVFWFRSSYFHGMGLQFGTGAMPHLQRLKVEFNARKTKFFYRNYDFGIQHLCSIVQVRAIIRSKDATDSETKAAVAAIKDQVSQIRKNPLPMPASDDSITETDKSTTSGVDIKISIFPDSSSHLASPGPTSFVVEDAMVSSSAGAMNSVISKLTALMGERYAELTGTTDKQELILRDELLAMNALLIQLSHMRGLDKQMEECRNQMRELTYDIDDSIDDLTLHFIEEEDGGSTDKRVMPHDFIDQIQKLNKRVEKTELPRVMSKVEMQTLGPRHVAREQWLSIAYDEGSKPAERDGPSLESLWSIYEDLSTDMKTCLLYLSIFPANRVLRKDKLIRRWAAEGFLPKRSVETWWEIGESYILELITKELIEPVYADEEDVLLPMGCKVFRSVHDFITNLSNKENFAPVKNCVSWILSNSCYRLSREDAASEKKIAVSEESGIMGSSSPSTTGSKKSRTSTIWQIFEKIVVRQPNGTETPAAKCIKCKKIFSTQGGTTNLHRHASLHGHAMPSLSCQKRQIIDNQKKCSKVRSLIADFKSPWWIQNLSAFKHVRVLDIEDVKLLHQELRCVGCLSLLRYLGLEWEGPDSLPQEVTALEHLETVDLSRNRWLLELPKFKSTKLVSLIADNVRLPIEMGEMKLLEELSTVRVGSGDGNRLAKVVKESKRLRRLGVAIADVAISELMDLLVVIGNSNIQSLWLHDWLLDGSILLDLLQRCLDQQRPCYYEKLVLQLGISLALQEIPKKKMSPFLIQALTQLSINVETLDTEGLCILGNLTNLVTLSLIHHGSPYSRQEDKRGVTSIIRSYSFRCLRVFRYHCMDDGGMRLQFEAGAMPQLRRLWLKFNVRETELDFTSVDFGIQFLTSLVQIRVIIGCTDSTAASVGAMEAVMRTQVSRNRSIPLLVITRERSQNKQSFVGVTR